MVKISLIKSPDEWATTKQACRDELVVYLCFSSHIVYFALLWCIEHCSTKIKFYTLYIYIYIYIYIWLNTIKSTTKAPVVDRLRLNTLRDTKTAFLTPKRYDERSCPFYLGVVPHPFYPALRVCLRRRISVFAQGIRTLCQELKIYVPLFTCVPMSIWVV